MNNKKQFNWEIVLFASAICFLFSLISSNIYYQSVVRKQQNVIYTQDEHIRWLEIKLLEEMAPEKHKQSEWNFTETNCTGPHGVLCNFVQVIPGKWVYTNETKIEFCVPENKTITFKQHVDKNKNWCFEGELR